MIDQGDRPRFMMSTVSRPLIVRRAEDPAYYLAPGIVRSNNERNNLEMAGNSVR